MIYLDRLRLCSQVSLSSASSSPSSVFGRVCIRSLQTCSKSSDCCVSSSPSCGKAIFARVSGCGLQNLNTNCTSMSLSSIITIGWPQLILAIIKLRIGKTKLRYNGFSHDFHLVFSEHLKIVVDNLLTKGFKVLTSCAAVSFGKRIKSDSSSSELTRGATIWDWKGRRGEKRREREKKKKRKKRGVGGGKKKESLFKKGSVLTGLSKLRHGETYSNRNDFVVANGRSYFVFHKIIPPNSQFLRKVLHQFLNSDGIFPLLSKIHYVICHSD